MFYFYTIFSRRYTAYAIHSQIAEVYAEEATSRQLVAKRCHFFQSGRQDAENCNMAGSGRPSFSNDRNHNGMD
ncbi:hypothetical protein TNCV_3463981 [Trichonephila clavipes]|nr:hypothetical protein TNCV_457951 [Trichonephila clavipes]GFX67509.1 hypothetical protein TNCV_3463981 [Trichonephila clavipes]